MGTRGLLAESLDISSRSVPSDSGVWVSSFQLCVKCASHSVFFSVLMSYPGSVLEHWFSNQYINQHHLCI